MEAIHPFGVFVEVLPGQSGLVHVSELDTERTNDPADKARNQSACLELALMDVSWQGQPSFATRLRSIACIAVALKAPEHHMDS